MGAKKLTSSEKAAVVLLALGEETASQIFTGLPREEARRIATALSRLGRLDESVVETVMAEFHAQLTRPASGVVGDATAARRLLAKALGDHAPLGGTLDFATPALADAVANLPPAVLAAYLTSEHPQTVALVLAHAAPRQAGETLRLLPAATHADVVGRIARLGPVDPEVLHELEASLMAEARRAGPAAVRRLGGADKVAALLATMDRASGEELLESLEEREPELAEAVRQLMFTFNDLVKINAVGMQVVLKQVPSATLRLALKSAPAAVAAHIYASLSGRAATLLKDDVAALPKVRVSEVEAAQAQIAHIARELAEAGSIQVASPDDVYV